MKIILTPFEANRIIAEYLTTKGKLRRGIRINCTWHMNSSLKDSEIIFSQAESADVDR